MGSGLQEETKAMMCVICKQGEFAPGTATVTLVRDRVTLVVKSVPATVCENCGEEYVDETHAAQLLQILAETSRAGVEVDVREYVAA